MIVSFFKSYYVITSLPTLIKPVAGLVGGTGRRAGTAVAQEVGGSSQTWTVVTMEGVVEVEDEVRWSDDGTALESVRWCPSIGCRIVGRRTLLAAGRYMQLELTLLMTPKHAGAGLGAGKTAAGGAVGKNKVMF